MKKIQPITGIIIIGLVLMLSTMVFAFSIFSNVAGTYRRYLQYADGRQYLPFKYQLNVDTSEDYTTAIQAAADTWSNVPTSYWVFEEGERSPKQKPSRDNVNLIYFDTKDSSENFEPNTDVIAFSMTWTNGVGEDYHAVESDLVWNARDFPPSSNPDNCPSDTMDLQSVVTHEFGHHLGLGHAGEHGSPPGVGELVPQATMYGYGAPGDTAKRSLHPQDVAGISEIYPVWQISGTIADSANLAPLGSSYILIKSGSAVRMQALELVSTGDRSVYEWPGYIATDSLFVRTDGSFSFTSLTQDIQLEFNCFFYHSEVQEVHFNSPGGIEETEVIAMDIRLQSRPGVKVVGLVADKMNATPISARLEFFSASNPGNIPVQVVLTDSAGNYKTTLPEGRYSLAVYPRPPYPQERAEDITISSDGLVYDLRLSPADVLLIDSDEGEDDWAMVPPLFESAGATVHLWDNFKEGQFITWQQVSTFPAPITVLWLNQERTTPFFQSEKNLLDSLLTNSGNLFLSGNHVGSLLADSVFLRQKLHSSFWAKSANQYLKGITDDPIGQNQLMMITTLESQKDVLLPDADLRTTPVFQVVGSGGYGMIRHESDAHLLVAGFVFEDIFDDLPVLINKTQLLQRSLAWFHEENQSPSKAEITLPVADDVYTLTSLNLDLAVDWNAAVDPQGDDVSYVLRISSDSSLVDGILISQESNTDSAGFSFQMPCELVSPDGTATLYAVVWATDGAHYTPSAITPYRIKFEIPPSAPEEFELLEPVDSADWVIKSEGDMRLFRWNASFDANCDPVYYEFQVAEDQAFTGMVFSATVYPDSEFVFSGANLLSRYGDDSDVILYWRVIAGDGEFEQTSAVRELMIRIRINHAPEVPALLSPVRGDTLVFESGAASYLFRWSGGDPDGETVYYDFALFADDPAIVDTTRKLNIIESQTQITLADFPGYPLEYGRVLPYRWSIAARDSSGAMVASDAFEVFVLSYVAVAVDNENSIPLAFSLDQNYPNPFNPLTQIGFSLAQAGQVSLEIYDLRGNRVRTILARHFAAGRYNVIWDGTDRNGQRVANGVYFYRLTAPEFTAVRKMLFMK